MTTDQLEAARVISGMIGVLVTAAMLALVLLWSWIDGGDADTNGDPERDAGKEAPHE